MDNTGFGDCIRRILLICIGLLAFRLLLGLAAHVGTGDTYGSFFLASDRFADSIKSGLAQLAVSGPLFNDPRIQEWPLLFQKYILDNNYLGPNLSIRHAPPLATLQLMVVAALMLSIPPLGVIGILTTIYATWIFGLAKAVKAVGTGNAAWMVVPLILLAYPSLFMLDRGNFHSGFTSLGVISYIISVHFRRWKWLGWLALALAVNLRPNVAIFALLELYRSRGRTSAVVGMFATGLMSVCIGLISLVIAQWIDPGYSLAAFFKGLAQYQTVYVEGLEGLKWNVSLQNVFKLARYQTHDPVLYNHYAAMSINLLGFACMAAFAALAWYRRISAMHFAFALAALCCLFTPVLAQYHMLIFVAPLLLLVLERWAALTPARLERGAILIAAYQLICLLYWFLAHNESLRITLIAPLACFGLAFPLIARRVLAEPDAGKAAPDTILALACIAALSPLGDALSNGLMEATILLSVLSWLLWHTAKAASKPTEEIISGPALIGIR